ncbi:MAG: sigma-E factor negative regulatory protein [Burkholderiales bacterium]|nr:sigma-E factor negative regulatory protein [Burkholderiales bacterium]
MKETLSAWIDDELSDQQAGQLPAQLKRDGELRRSWDCYHLIGDSLRGIQGPDLCAQIRARLDAEPTVLAPQRRSKPEKLRWAALSMAASVAAVAFVGWMALPGTQQDSLRLASAPAREVRLVATAAGEGAKDYLLAHQRYSPSSAMQGVAPYVRTVAASRASTRR